MTLRCVSCGCGRRCDAAPVNLVGSAAMAGTIGSSDVALLHHLQTAGEPGAQLPKHVAGLLQEQGLVEIGAHSPGEVALTERGRHRLAELLARRSGDDDIVP